MRAAVSWPHPNSTTSSTARWRSASLSASYEIDFWGKNRDAALAADETATANRFDREVVVLATNASVANTYFLVLSSQDRIRIAEKLT